MAAAVPRYTHGATEGKRSKDGRGSARSTSRSSNASTASTDEEFAARPADIFGLDALCGGCCTTRPKGLKVKRLKALEYATLLETMGVDDREPESRAYISPFLARFPHKLHPLLRPVFFHLGQGVEVNESEVDWATFVETLSRITHGSGATWEDLLDAFDQHSSDGDHLAGEPVGCRSPRSNHALSAQHAACLCFFFAHPYLAYSHEDVLTGVELLGSPRSDTIAACNNSWVHTPVGSVWDPDGIAFCESDRMKVDSLLSAIRPREPDRADADEVARKSSSSSVTAALCDFSRRDDVIAWLQAAVPCLPLAFGPQLANTLMGTALWRRLFPVVKSEILDAGLAFLLRGTSAELWESEDWTTLFDAQRDGRSFSGLMHSVQHYRGPVAMVIRTDNGDVLGAVSKYWADGNGDFCGGPDVYLFSLAPTLVVCRACGDSNFTYVNQRNKVKPRGIGFGGKIDSERHWFRLFISDSLDSGYVLQGDMTYQRAALLRGVEYETKFKISQIELWGCGVTGAGADLSAQKRQLQKMSEKFRKVDKNTLLRSRTDADIFFPRTFKATDDARETTGVLERRITTGSMSARTP